MLRTTNIRQCTQHCVNGVSFVSVTNCNATLLVYYIQAYQVSCIARVTQAIDSFHTLTHKTGLFHAWSWVMASSFTNIRDHRIKMPHALDHYLLYNRMYMSNYYPVYQVTSDCLIPWAVSWEQLYKVSIYVSHCFPLN